MNDQITIREIRKNDNRALALIIRNSLTEFNAAKSGTVFYDDTTDHLHQVFQKEKSKYLPSRCMKNLDLLF